VRFLAKEAYNLLAGRGAVLTPGLSLGFLAVTSDDLMGWDCCWAAATTTGTTERGAATGLKTTTKTNSAVWLLGITGEAADEAGDGVRLMAANSLAKTAALSNCPAAMASSSRNNMTSTRLSSLNSSAANSSVIPFPIHFLIE
jgi:hypothetical protein